MTRRREFQAITYALVLNNLQVSFQGLTQERILRCASIVKVRLYKSMAQQSSRQIIEIVAFFFFFYQGFLSWTMTTHRTAGEGRGPSFIPLYHFHPLTNIQTFSCDFACEMIITYF